MSKPAWKDVSSYSRGDKDHTPNAWQLELGRLRISVHRHIHYPPEVWLLTCEPFFSSRELLEMGAEDAKAEAMNLVQTTLEVATEELKKI